MAWELLELSRPLPRPTAYTFHFLLPRLLDPTANGGANGRLIEVAFWRDFSASTDRKKSCFEMPRFSPSVRTKRPSSSHAYSQALMWLYSKPPPHNPVLIERLLREKEQHEANGKLWLECQVKQAFMRDGILGSAKVRPYSCNSYGEWCPVAGLTHENMRGLRLAHVCIIHLAPLLLHGNGQSSRWKCEFAVGINARSDLGWPIGRQ